jgi:hypothetical protein
MRKSDQEKIIKLIIKESLINEGLISNLQDKYKQWQGNRAIAKGRETKPSGGQLYASHSFGSSSKFPDYLVRANFINSTLTGVLLLARNLESANFTNAKLIRVDFRGASLIDAIFDGATIEDCVWEGADVQGASFQNLKLQGGTFEIGMENESNEEKTEQWIKNFKKSVINGNRIRVDAEYTGGTREHSARQGKKIKAEEEAKFKEAKERVDRELKAHNTSELIDMAVTARLYNDRQLLSYITGRVNPDVVDRINARIKTIDSHQDRERRLNR